MGRTNLQSIGDKLVLLADRNDFLNSKDLDQWTDNSDAGNTVALTNTANGQITMTTSGVDNEQCALQDDNGVWSLVPGKHVHAWRFKTPADLGNVEFAFGLATKDTKWFGNAETATELLVVGLVDQNGGTTNKMIVRVKGTSASDTTHPVALVASTWYELVITIDVDENTTTPETPSGSGTVKVELFLSSSQEIADAGPAMVVFNQYSYLPLAALARSVCVVNGSAASNVLRVDYVDSVQPRNFKQ